MSLIEKVEENQNTEAITSSTDVEISLDMGAKEIQRPKKYSKIDDSRRFRIISAYQDGRTIKEIMRYELLPKSTVSSIIKNFLSNGQVIKKPKGGKTHEKIDDLIKSYIRSVVDNNCTLSLKKISTMVFDVFDLCVSQTEVFNCLKALHFTLKDLQCIPERRNDDESKAARKLYAERFMQIEESYPDSNIFFVDEVGFNISMRIKKGRSLVGTTPTTTMKNIRSKNISVCCAYTKRSVSFYEVNHKPYNTESFLGYISNLFSHIESLEIENCIVIMDNVRFHKHRDVINVEPISYCCP